MPANVRTNFDVAQGGFDFFSPRQYIGQFFFNHTVLTIRYSQLNLFKYRVLLKVIQIF
jgi:hypothetical protein